MIKNRITRRTFSKATIAAASTLALPHLARAQAYPTRPIRFVLAFGAGGVADITARIAADKLGEKLGQRIVVENQPGPGGIAAARSVTSAPADGHTLGLVTNGTAISVGAYNALPFDPVKDFAPISLLGSFGLVFAANAQSPFKTVGDFLKAAREQPGKLNVGTINIGGTQNLAAELFKSSAGVNFQIIPYRGTPEIVIALLRNDVQLLIDFYAPLKGALSDNQIRPIGTAGLARARYLPDLPIVADAVPGYEVTAWNGIFAKAGTAPNIIAQLNRALHEVLVMPDVISKYIELGVEAKASSPEELQAHLKTDIVKWAAVIDKAGIPKQ
jgi:tripartite-type tricarboxylate transporter receptor subunit TctC